MKIKNDVRDGLPRTDIEYDKLFIDASGSIGVVIEFRDDSFVVWMNIAMKISYPDLIDYPIRYLSEDEIITLSN